MPIVLLMRLLAGGECQAGHSGDVLSYLHDVHSNLMQLYFDRSFTIIAVMTCIGMHGVGRCRHARF